MVFKLVTGRLQTYMLVPAQPAAVLEDLSNDLPLVFNLKPAKTIPNLRSGARTIGHSDVIDHY